MSRPSPGEGMETTLRAIDRKLSALLLVEATIAGLLALWGAAAALAAAGWLRRSSGP